jgi:elongation factor Tu
VLVRGVKKSEARRGYVLAAPETMKAYTNFSAKIYVLTKKEGGRHSAFTSNYKPHSFLEQLMLQEL